MYYNYSDLNYINQELAVVWPGWTAVKLLGKGSFGAVYEIHRTVRGNLEKAAMKVLRVPDSDAEVARIQFQGMTWQNTEEYYEKYVDGIHNEIRIMQKFVGNSHIVSYEDYSIRKRYNQIGWDLYIRMELLAGLPEYMKSKSFDEKTIVRLGMDIAQGLRDCHNKGIIHRDVKPENIFVNEAENFKLGDFGISRNAPGSHDVLSFKGTLGYMAPEVYRMLSTDARSDIYSLGMVMYQCLNDNRLPFIPSKFSPFDIETAQQRRFAGEPIPAPAHGSQALKNIVLIALEDRPEDRFQTAEDLYYELMEVYRTDYSTGRRSAGSIGSRAGRDEYRRDYNYDKSAERKAEYGARETVLLEEEPPVENSLKAEEEPSKVVFDDISKQVEKSTPPKQEQNRYLYEPKIKKKRSREKAVDKKKSNNIIIAIIVVMIVSVSLFAFLSFNNQGNNAGSSEQNFNSNAIDWKDAALEEKMREITGIKHGGITYTDLNNITQLDLSNSNIRDISALSNLTNLTNLNLYNNQINDISALGGLTNLTELSLHDNQISDISALSNLTNLTNLNLNNNQINDISALSKLYNLTELCINHNQINDVSALSKLTNLTSLDLELNEISDISALINLTNLTSLKLAYNEISYISVLSIMTNLTSLDLSNNQISDIRALKNLTNLTYLDLGGNQISDISVLSNLTNLTSLNLEFNEISNISGLGNLTNLTSLDLSHNEISDISGLGNLTNLTFLDLNRNKISDISELSNLTNLTILDIDFNPINDYSPIEDLNIKGLIK